MSKHPRDSHQHGDAHDSNKNIKTEDKSNDNNSNSNKHNFQERGLCTAPIGFHVNFLEDMLLSSCSETTGSPPPTIMNLGKALYLNPMSKVHTFVPKSEKLL